MSRPQHFLQTCGKMGHCTSLYSSLSTRGARHMSMLALPALVLLFGHLPHCKASLRLRLSSPDPQAASRPPLPQSHSKQTAQPDMRSLAALASEFNMEAVDLPAQIYVRSSAGQALGDCVICHLHEQRQQITDMRICSCLMIACRFLATSVHQQH